LSLISVVDTLRSCLLSRGRHPLKTNGFGNLYWARLNRRQLTEIQTSNASFAHVLSDSLRHEGPIFLFKGWTPAFIRLGPNTVLMFVFYEVRVYSRYFLPFGLSHSPANQEFVEGDEPCLEVHRLIYYC